MHAARHQAPPPEKAEYSAGKTWEESVQRNLGSLRRRKRFRGWSGHLSGWLSEPEGKLPSRASEVLVALISFHDSLHQAVANNIAFVEIHEADAFHAAQNIHRVDQTAALAGGQVDLREIAGNNHLGIETLPREHHLHLLRRTVLGFVQNDETVVQSAAAHERNGCYFNDGTLEQLFHLLRLQHVVEGIVQRAEIGVHFFLQIARQETQAFAGLHRWTGQHDTAYTLVDQCGHRHGYGEIGFSGTGGTDTKNQVVAFDGFHVAPLIDSFWRQRFLAEIPLAAAVHQAAQRHFGVFGDHAQVAVQVAIGEALPFLHQCDVILQDAGRADDVRFLAFDLQRIVPQAGGDVQSFFEDADVFIAGSEKGLDATGDLNAEFHSKMRIKCIEEQRGKLAFQASSSRQDRKASSASAEGEQTSTNIIPEGDGGNLRLRPFGGCAMLNAYEEARQGGPPACRGVPPRD